MANANDNNSRPSLWKRPQSAAVIGAGAWGTTIANLLAKNGLEVSLWAYEAELVDIIKKKHENVMYLPGIKLDEKVRPSNDFGEVIKGRPIVVFVTPSQLLRPIAQNAAPYISEGTIIVCCSKGIEKESLMLMPDVLEDVLGRKYIHDTAFISGPSFAKEVAEGQATSVAVAAHDPRVASHVREIFENKKFSLYENPDVTGIEVCGAVKNVIAIAVGVCQGLGCGFNTRAAVITRGLNEIIKIGTALGANPLTFSGLAGVGDLILTCTSPLSRNTTLGNQLGRGEKLKNILAATHTVAEGVDTAKSVNQLALKYSLDLPVCNQVYNILHENMPVKDFVSDIVSNDLRHDIGRVRVT